MKPTLSYSEGHPNCAAHRWLDETLVLDERPRLDTAEAIELVNSEPVERQIAILKACVERLPALREGWTNKGIYELGEQLYAIACALYSKNLPFAESDVCDLLCLSKHGCGHGGDVAAPVDLAVSYLSQDDASSRLLSSLATYVDGLKGVGSCQAQTAKRRASIVFLLDRNDVLGHKRKDLWGRSFTDDLAAMDDEERTAWERLVLSFKLNQRSELPNSWKKIAQSFTKRLGDEEVVARISGWWPRESSVCKLATGSSHLLKHFVWLVEAVDGQSPIKARCHELVSLLSTVRWKPEQPAAKVVGAAACYLVKLPPELAWEPLQAFCAAASTREQKVRQLVAKYASEHGIENKCADLTTA